MLNKIIDKAIDFVYSKNNRKYILLLFIIGLLLRILVAFANPSGADEMLHSAHSIGFIESGKLQIMDEDAVWFFLTDMATKIFGVTIFGIRFIQILFGSLLIILTYLLGKQIFDKKIALLASAIITFSSFQLMQIQSLMDIPMAFFALFSVYFLILFLKSDKQKYFLFTWVSIGIAIMIKQIALSFIPALVLFSLYYNKKYRGSFRIKQIFYAALIVFIIILPILVNNYLLYKDKGILDLQFARFTKISFETYQGIANTIEPFSINTLLFSSSLGAPGFIIALRVLYNNEALIPIALSLLGLFFFLKEKNKFKWLLILSFVFPFIFLAGTSLLSNHFVFASPYIALLSSLAIIRISEKFQQEKFKKILIFSILALIIIFNSVKVNKEANGFFSRNEIGQLINLKYESITPDSLVIADSRIYRGRIVLMFWDRHYLETNYFPNLLKSMENITGNEIQIPIYFIEAVTDDSGWGTVKNQPEFNQTSEEIASYLKANSQLIETIDSRDGQPHFNVYKSNIMIKSQALQFADSTHFWFYYPVAYKPKGSSFDDYNTYTALDSILNELVYFILYIEVFIALFLAIYTFFLLKKIS